MLHSIALSLPLLVALPAVPGPIGFAGPLGCAGPTADVVTDLARVVERFRGIGAHGAVLVAAGDEIVFQEAFGWADREKRIPMSVDTVFTLGSITKSFTAVAILKLQMAGKLALDDTLGQHFEGVPADRRDVTLRQLLTHSAGFPDALGDDWDLAGTRERLLADALRAPLEHEPGAGFHYSNVGYSLLGMIVEDVSGMPYETYLREAVLLPLGMRRTGYLAPAYAEGDLAVGYERGGERWGTVLSRPMLADGPCWHLRANGGLHTTLGDMQRFANGLHGEELLSQAVKDEAFAAGGSIGGEGYGYGFEVGRIDAERRRIGHSGGNGIFSTYFRIYPEEGLMLLVTSTVDQISVRQLMPAFEGALFGLPIDLPPATVELDAETLSALAGRYVSDDGAALALEVNDRGLRLAPANAAGFALVSGDPKSPRLGELVRRTEDALWRSSEGDFAALHAAYGVEVSLAEFGVREQERQALMAAEYGELQGIEAVHATPAGDGADIVVRFDYERGEVLLEMGWRGGAIGEIRPVDGIPRPHFELFPTSATTFEVFRLVRPVDLRVRFEDGGLVLESAGRRARAVRAD